MSISWNASLPISAADDVAGEGDHRHGVELRGRDRRDEVRGARAAGAHAHADLAAGPRVAVGGVAAALLVPHEHVPDLGVVAEDVVDRQDDAARVAEQGVGALEDQRLHQRVRPDPRALEPAPGPLVEHVAPRLLDRGRGGGAVARHVAAARRAGRARVSPWPAARPSSSSCPLRSLRPAALRPSGHTKTLATRRGSLRFSVAGASAASVPPCPSVLPPGAGNKEEPKKVLKAGKRASEEGREEVRPGAGGRAGARSRGGRRPSRRRRRGCGGGPG